MLKLLQILSLKLFVFFIILNFLYAPNFNQRNEKPSSKEFLPGQSVKIAITLQIHHGDDVIQIFRC